MALVDLFSLIKMLETIFHKSHHENDVTCSKSSVHYHSDLIPLLMSSPLTTLFGWNYFLCLAQLNRQLSVH